MGLTFKDGDGLKGGLPIGGLGCGVLQVFPDGTRGAFTGLNNWHAPLTQLHQFRHGEAADFRHANPFGIFVDSGETQVARLLQHSRLADCPTVQEIVLEASFPIATLTCRDPALPIEVTLTHFSPFIPHESKDSGLPVVVTMVRVTNPTDHPLTVGVLGCCLNVVGSWMVGRYNRTRRQGNLMGIECRRKTLGPPDERAGEVALVVEVPAGARGRRQRTRPDAFQASYLTSWMYATEAFRAQPQDRRLEAWHHFARSGRLPNDATSQEAMGELDEPMGAVAVRFVLAPGQTREAVFSYSWFMPNHPYGHRYERWFTGAWDVARYVLPRHRTLLQKTCAWQTTIRGAGLPDWLSEALINSLAVYPAASWWTRDGRFAMVENPIKWPLMGTLDVRYYGTFPLALWFPSLERSTMLQFAKAQRSDGRIPHDLGHGSLDCPSDGTTAGRPWKDLATKFALMAYRDVLWGGGATFLRQIYPSVKRAMRWEFTTDRNGDGLPDNEGADCTYDLWSFYGASAYTASIFLAALQASCQLAQMVKDEPFRQECLRWLRKGSRSFEAKLWTGSYYRAARGDDGSSYEACTTGQLNGQWYAHLLGLGYVVPRQHARQAVETILALNGKASRFGAVNSVFPDGTIDGRSWHSGNIWIGETYATAALAICEGLVEEGLELTRRTWMSLVEHAKQPWSQPDVMAASDGQLGDGEFYLRNVSIWSVPIALARVDRRVRAMLKVLAPACRVGVKRGHVMARSV